MTDAGQLPKFEKIRYERDGFIARVTINRPERMNAIDGQTSDELRAAFEDFRYNDDLRVAIVTGAGDRAFSAGADLVARAKGEKRQPSVHITQAGLAKGPPIYKPIIAAINGYCLAGGLELALACDIRIAAPTATFGLAEVRWGIIPGGGGTQRLPRAIPLALANEMILTAEPIDAERALQAGLISRIVPADGCRPRRRASRRSSARAAPWRSAPPRSSSCAAPTCPCRTPCGWRTTSRCSSTPRRTPSKARARSPRSARPTSRPASRAVARAPRRTAAGVVRSPHSVVRTAPPRWRGR